MEKLKSGGRAPKTKDRNAEKFWTFLAETTASCKAKAQNLTWGKRKLAAYLKNEGVVLTESQVPHCCEGFVYDLEEDCLFYKSTDLQDVHRRCVSPDQLITLLTKEHNRDPRQEKDGYNSLRLSYYPVVWDTVLPLLKQYVQCEL